VLLEFGLFELELSFCGALLAVLLQLLLGAGTAGRLGLRMLRAAAQPQRQREQSLRDAMVVRRTRLGPCIDL
jgi:hypothetical protein